VTLEVLHLALVALGRGAGGEGPQVSPLSGAGVELARIETVPPGREFADHGVPPAKAWARRQPLQARRERWEPVGH